MTLDKIPRRFDNRTIVVLAPGPSLNKELVRSWVNYVTIAVNDAWMLAPYADILYACDSRWWKHNDGVKDFKGEKWSVLDKEVHKNDVQRRYGITLVNGKHGTHFSSDPSHIIYGKNSGFQAVNLAILFGARRIILVGFDMRKVNGASHFFGDHKPPLFNNSSYAQFIEIFRKAKESIPEGVEILNATPDSALDCFPFVEDLEDA